MLRSIKLLRKKPAEAMYRLCFNSLLLSVLLVGIACIVNTNSIVGRPFGGFLTFWLAQSNQYQVSIDTPTNWPELASGNLRIGDLILSINGQPPVKAQEVYNELGTLPTEQQIITYTILRNGIQLSIQAHLYYFTIIDFIEVKLPQFLLAFACWALSVIVFWVQPDNESNRAFALAALASAGAALMPGTTIFSGSFWSSENIAILANVLTWGIFSPLLGAAAVHFISVFPEANRSSFIFRIRYWLYCPSFLVLLSNLYTSMFWQKWSPINAILGEVQIYFFGVSFAVALIFGIGRYTYLYLTTSLIRIKKQLLIIVLGWFLGILLPMIPYIAYLITGNWWIPGYSNSTAFYMALLPAIAFSYSILRYQLFRRTGILTFLAIAYISTMITFILTLILLPIADKVPLPAILLCATVVAGVSWHIDTPLNNLFTRLQHREAVCYHTLEKFSRTIGQTTDLKSLPKVAIDSLIKQLEIDKAALWFYELKSNSFQLADVTNIDEFILTASIAVTKQLVDFLIEHSQPIRLELGKIGILQPEINGLLKNHGFEVLIPLVNEKELIGLVALGKRWSGDIFDEQDLDFLVILGNQISMAVQIGRQVAELRQIPQRVAETQEKERYRMARELHDTTQQFLGRLPFFLEVGRGQMRTDVEKADQIILDCLYDIQNAARDLRDLRRNLTPGLILERGLVDALQVYANHLASRSLLKLDFSVKADVDNLLSSEAKYGLYRVIQQGVDNIVEHAHAKSMKITINDVDNCIRFEISDDGQGFVIPDIREFVRNGHYGLQFMIDRITLLGGQLTIESVPEKGTIVQGFIPKVSLENS